MLEFRAKEKRGIPWALALILSFTMPSGFALAKGDFTILSGVDRRKLNPQPDYEKTMKEGTAAKGANAKCNSGYRSADTQRKICAEMPNCGPQGCPGRCAPPGRSNHQHVATCDIQGLPGGAKQGCDFLFEMCQQMRSRDRSLQCEIGGYGSGAHHLAVGKGIKPSAYNQCKYLKSKMGMDPGRDKRLQDDANKLEKEIMGGNPQQAAQAPGGGGSPAGGGGAPSGGGSPGGSSPAASYPTAINSGATSPTPGSSNEVSSARDSGAGNQLNRGVVDIKSPAFANKDSEITKGGEGGFSGISGSGGHLGDPGMTGAGVAGSENGTGASRALPASSGGFGSGSSGASADGGGSAKGSAGGESGGGSSPGGSSEVLNSYSGGGGGGGRLSSSGVSLPGSDIDAAVKNLEEEFQGDMDREPASEEAAQDEAELLSPGNLFERAHTAHERCLRRGCVSRAK